MPPRWLMIVGSMAIGFHLLTLGIQALAAPSGPWPMEPMGAAPMPPPVFAARLYDLTGSYYLPAIKLTHNYHFLTNNTSGEEIYLEAHLTDRDGNAVTIKLPEDGANFWVRHRQSLLANGLAGDMPRTGQGAPTVMREGQKAATVSIWFPREEDLTRGELGGDESKKLKELAHRFGVKQEALGYLKELEEYRLSRTVPSMGPNRRAMVLADAYARHLCRQYGADKVELVRYFQSRIPPVFLDPQQEAMPGAFSKQASYFGELPR
jgi:hypothetical protein